MLAGKTGVRGEKIRYTARRIDFLLIMPAQSAFRRGFDDRTDGLPVRVTGERI